MSDKIMYKGRGEHSVSQLELIIEQQAEELHSLKSGQKAIESNCTCGSNKKVIVNNIK